MTPRLALLLSLVTVPESARAFHGATDYVDSAQSGGGAGMYFTGSRRWKGYDCTICHVDAPGEVALVLASDPPDLLAGTYRPGVTYRISFSLAGEHLGGAALANRNAFVAEMTDDAWEDVPGWAAPGDDVEVLDGGRVVAATVAESRAEWAMDFTAPAAGAGALTLHVGAVDADGAGDTLQRRTDPLGDDVVVAALRLCEAGTVCTAPIRAAPPISPAACSAVPGPPSRTGERAAARAVAALALAFLVLALRARRRRVLALTALVVLAAGCFDPVVPAECPDRVCGQPSGPADPPGPDPDAGVLPPGVDASVPPSDCDEDWVCGPWQPAEGANQATRTCVDQNGRGTTRCKPTEGPIDLPDLDLDYYKCNVEPILDRGCAMMACHGTDTERAFRVYARGRLRNSETVDRVNSCLERGTVNLQEAASGTVMCEGWLPHTATEWQRNFDSARSFMVGVAAAEQSELLLQPVVGGRSHVGVHLFTRDDPDYQTLLAWLQGARLGRACDTGPN